MQKNLLLNILTSSKCHPYSRKIRDLAWEDVPWPAWTMGNAIVGEQGCGKSTMSAGIISDYAIHNERDAIISLDHSGSFTDDLLSIFASQPLHTWAAIRKRIRYLRLGDPVYAKPIIEFSEEHGVPFEDQIKRVQTNFVKLMEDTNSAPVLITAALKIILPHLFRLLVSMRHIGIKEPWQITEAPILLDDPSRLQTVLNRLGDSLDEDTRRFFETRFLGVKESERELRSYTLGTVFSDMGMDGLVGQLGNYRSVINIKEVMDKGLILLIDGSNTMNRNDIQNYVFTQVFSLVMEQINLRQAHNPKNNKVVLFFDEVVNIFKIPGMSEALSQLPSQYRSRGLVMFIILQTLTQLDEKMREGFWSLANIYCFGLLNKKDAEEIAYQFNKYEAQKVKQYAKTEMQNNTTEPLTGQDRELADWITEMSHRELILRRRYSEKEKDVYTRHVKKTRDVKMSLSWERLNALKDELMQEGGIPIAEVKRVSRERLESLKATSSPTRPNA